MQKETRRRIAIYKNVLPSLRDRVIATLIVLLVSMLLAAGATYAWLTISRAPAVSNLQTTLSSNGSLEIALAKEDGSHPDEFDIDESVGVANDVTVTNLQWGNLINLYDDYYGIENLALRPAELNIESLLTSPLKAAVYGGDGRVDKLNSDFAYAHYDSEKLAFVTDSSYLGVRAIASVKTVLAEGTQAVFNSKKNDLDKAYDAVSEAYDKVPATFSGMGTMISKYAQAKVEDSSYATGSYSNDPDLASNLSDVLKLYSAVRKAMDAQKNAYVALANFQSYAYTYNNGGTFTELTWDDLLANKANYNTNSATLPSVHGVISLYNLTKFISDYNTFIDDYQHFNKYNEDYKANGTGYYWAHGGDSGYYISSMIARLINYNNMTIDLNNDGTEIKVLELQSHASDALSANGQSRKVYVPVDSILGRFEQNYIKENYRLNGRGSCTIAIKAKMGITASMTIYGLTYTKASGLPTFASNISASKAGLTLVANDSVAEDTYGMAIDMWVRTNAESTCLTLEGAETIDDEGNIVSYDGINRIWGATGTKVLTTESTTQGGGSFYVYYADTPEDYERSKQLLDAIKVAFVDESGNLMATASMDTANILSVNGRHTVPLIMDSSRGVSYTYFNELNEEVVGRAITTLYNDVPVRIEAIIYLDGAHLENDNVLSNSEIQGQLNIQFGSSEELQTLGSNNLKGESRTVTATVSKTSLDFDNAVNDEDLTTSVLVNIEGADPTVVQAYVMRAISSTQGSRDGLLNFVKQADGSWTADYKFTAPGTYYIRYVRFDGADYALADPQKIEVAGFALKSLTWRETNSEASVLTSQDTYSETVTVEFATNDRTKMPSLVKAEFMSANGNTNIATLSYNSSNGKWSGTATFSSSGEYKLKYLIFDDKYKDLEPIGYLKTLKLNLGLYAQINDMSGRLEEQYEAGHTYSRNVGVKIYDNSGTEITGLTGVRLYYSNGGSSTNTINTELVWEETEQRYLGTLGIVRAGRYSFSSILITGGSITKSTDSPVYRIFSPDPPIYDTTSVSTYHSSIQFAPLTNDAVIDNVKIANSESAVVDAVVYNDLANKYFELKSEYNDLTFTGSSWVINLPAYTLDVDGDGNALEGARYTQEGKWSLVLLSISECYDENGNERTSSNPILMAGKDTISTNYLTESPITSTDKKYDFSNLSTDVSCTIKVQFVPGTTSLGNSSDEFMSHYTVDNTDMYVLLTDNNGNIIPTSKISNVQLGVTYAPPSSDASYGYKVLSSAARDYTITLNNQDDEDGHRTVSGEIPDWQYVGEYKVNNLTVNVNGTALKYTISDGVGLPEKYTVTTAGPSSENIELLESDIVQRNKIIGKTGDNVTGTFLQGGDPGVTAKISLKTADNSETRYVVVEGVSMQLVLTHQPGTSQANGGYTFVQGTSQYESVTLNLTNNSGTYQSAATPLLAGTYTAKLKATINGSTLTKDLSNISVYSLKPTASITGVSPDPSDPIEGSFDMNTNITTPDTSNQLYYYDIAKANFIRVQNYYTSNLANVYIAATGYIANDHETNQCIDYTLPEVTVKVTNLGNSFANASMVLTNGMGTFNFTPSANTATAEIGKLGSGSYSFEENNGTCGSTQTVTYEVQQVAGEQTISAITMVDANGTSYNLAITEPITIRELNTAPPSISYVTVEGYSTPTTQTSSNGGSFQVTLPTSIGTTSQDVPKTDGSVDWVTVSNTSQKLQYVEITSDKKTRSYSSSCSGTTPAQWTTTGNYHLYTRTTLVEEKTSSTRTYRTTYGVTGWIVDGVTYAPGQTITITSAVSATPVIGVISETGIGNASVMTTRRTTITDVSNGTKSFNNVGTGSGSSDTASESSAKTNAYTKTFALQSGYSWFDGTSQETMKIDGHYAVPQVETVTLS